METKDRIANNKLIAEFMGWTEYVNSGNILIYKKGEDMKSISQLEFNNSWDWLMPVVTHINTMEDNRFTIIIKAVDIEIWKENELLIDWDGHVPSDELIGSVYGAVVQFIKWFNQNK